MVQGANFCKVDLHVHTPCSECFPDKSITSQMIVDQAIKVGMKAIAITDHNSGDAIDDIKAAAKDKDLVIFPGVEINVQPGVHVLAIFPEDKTSSNVTDLLNNLGLGTEERSKNSSVVQSYGIMEVLSRIKKSGALPLLAHIDNMSGAWHELRKSGQTFLQLWEKGEYVAVEIVGDCLPKEIGKDPFSRIPAYFWASDDPDPEDSSKHSHLGIGSKYSLFKLSEPITWEGLRLCFQDPSTRIRSQNTNLSLHPTIESIKIDGGFLDGFEVEMNPNLNCFIGGRGTGKSCLVETIRYAFDIQPKTDENAKTSANIVNHTFIPGSKITIRVKIDSHSEYSIERFSGERPRVFRLGEEQPIAIDPLNLLPIQVYGQKEIYEISQEASFQLRLLDNFIGDSIKPLKTCEERILSDLRENASQIINIDEEIDSLKSETSNLGTITEQLKRLELHDLPTKLKVKNNFDREKELLEQSRSKILEFKRKLSTCVQDNQIVLEGFKDEEIEDLPNCDLLKRQRDVITDINIRSELKIDELQSQIDEMQNQLQVRTLSWETEFSRQESEYLQILRESQSDGMGIDPTRYINLQREQRRLQTSLSVLQEKQIERNSLMTSRVALLEKLRASRRRQFELRQQKASELSHALKDKVRITIWPQGNRGVYQSHLEDIFSGTRTRSDVLQKIVETQSDTPERTGQNPLQIGEETRYLVPEIPRFLDQIDLANAIQNEKELISDDLSILTTTYGVSTAMRNYMCSISQEKLMDLQLVDIPDRPIIELQVASGLLGYKPLDSLSIGQKCTVLLSLVLLENPAPLLIDQPEDDLDNHFIFDQIVTTLRSEKEKRQFLIVTHNANIPVSGDAELIVVLDADERHGQVANNGMGSIDSQHIKSHVEHILEGGKDAFLIRKEKYGI